MKWDESFYSGRLGGQELLQKVQTPGTLNTGTTLAYGWGLQIGEYRGLPIVEHGGSLGGYRAHLIRIPSQHTSVALLCNSSTIAPSGLARRVADLAISDRFTKPVPPPPSAGTPGSNLSQALAPIPANLQAEYAGVYYSEELDATFTLSTDGSTVFLQRDTDAAPVALESAGSVNVFRVRGTTIRFPNEPGQPTTRFIVDAGRVRGITFVRK